MKAVWKGNIAFGLVSIAIELYSAIQAEALGFTLLHKKDATPITYKRWCESCNKEVVWDEIIKGIKLPNGSYFMITPANLEKLKPKKTDTITITEFIKTSAIEPIYYERHYYVVPSKVTGQAFSLFVSVMNELDLSAIGTFVMRDKEYICAIKGYQNGLLLSTLHYTYEIKKVAQFNELELSPNLDSREKKLAEQFIKNLLVQKFDISGFKNRFAQELIKKIKAQAKGAKITQKIEKPIIAQPEKNLLNLLRANLEQKSELQDANHKKIKPAGRIKDKREF